MQERRREDPGGVPAGQAEHQAGRPPRRARAEEGLGEKNLSVAPGGHRPLGACYDAGVLSRQLEVAGVRVPSFVYGTAWKEDATERLTRLALETGFRGL